MCTVSYIPTESGFIFTSNRDELPSRSATIIEQEGQIFFPRDAKAKGTWFAIERNKRLRCILNGAFVKHKVKENYGLSRGIMLLDSFDYSSFEAFVSNFNFQQVEPFTLIEVDFTLTIKLKVLRWNGEKTSVEELNPKQFQLWSSVTLYNEEMREKREQIFHSFVQNIKLDIESIQSFHLSEPFAEEAVNFKMKRKNGIETISLTQFNFEDKSLIHKNLIDELVELNEV